MMGYETFHPEVTGPFPSLAWVTADHKPVLLDGHQVPCMRSCSGPLPLLLQKSFSYPNLMCTGLS